VSRLFGFCEFIVWCVVGVGLDGGLVLSEGGWVDGNFAVSTLASFLLWWLLDGGGNGNFFLGQSLEIGINHFVIIIVVNRCMIFKWIFLIAVPRIVFIHVRLTFSLRSNRRRRLQIIWVYSGLAHVPSCVKRPFDRFFNWASLDAWLRLICEKVQLALESGT
jgi:hypothetical protein